jgi:hypothetical protein
MIVVEENGDGPGMSPSTTRKKKKNSGNSILYGRWIWSAAKMLVDEKQIWHPKIERIA